EAVHGMFTERLLVDCFVKRIQAHDMVLYLVLGLEDGLKPAQDGDTRPLAPDDYHIKVSPAVMEHIQARYPNLGSVLSAQIIDIAAGAGYRLRHTPLVNFVASSELANHQIIVSAGHTHLPDS